MSAEDVRITYTQDGGWMVAVGNTSLAGFYGPRARRMAESHRELLVAALSDARDRRADLNEGSNMESEM